MQLNYEYEEKNPVEAAFICHTQYQVDTPPTPTSLRTTTSIGSTAMTNSTIEQGLEPAGYLLRSKLHRQVSQRRKQTNHVSLTDTKQSQQVSPGEEGQAVPSQSKLKRQQSFLSSSSSQETSVKEKEDETYSPHQHRSSPARKIKRVRLTGPSKPIQAAVHATAHKPLHITAHKLIPKPTSLHVETQRQAYAQTAFKIGQYRPMTPSTANAIHPSPIPNSGLGAKYNPVTNKIEISKVPHPLPVTQEPSPPAEQPMITGIDPVVETEAPRKRFALLRQLGKGGCGDVYLAKEIDTRGDGTCDPTHYALKFVKNPRQFKSELATLKALNTHRAGRGYTPKLVAVSRKRRALVMEYLSESLAKQFEKCNYHFTLKTISMLALTMMDLCKDFYDKTGQVHVDIKPSNFCIGNGTDLYLIDFGYSMQPDLKLPGQTGTPLFMSQKIQTIGACCPTWQDDLESIGYVIMFFIAGGKRGLPWGALRTHRDIAASKNDLAIADFCNRLVHTEYAAIARPLQTFLSITRDRTRVFQDSQDFLALRKLFTDMMASNGMQYDKKWDWLNLPSQPTTRIAPVPVATAPALQVRAVSSAPNAPSPIPNSSHYTLLPSPVPPSNTTVMHQPILVQNGLSVKLNPTPRAMNVQPIVLS